MVRRLMSVVAVVIGIGTMTPPSHLGLAQGGGQPAWVPGRPGDWLLHNLDQHNRRFSPLDEINRTKPEQLTVKWTVELPKNISLGTATPIVRNGVMYFNAGSKFFAVDAESGRTIWTKDIEAEGPGGGRGRCGSGP